MRAFDLPDPPPLMQHAQALGVTCSALVSCGKWARTPDVCNWHRIIHFVKRERLWPMELQSSADDHARALVRSELVTAKSVRTLAFEASWLWRRGAQTSLDSGNLTRGEDMFLSAAERLSKSCRPLPMCGGKQRSTMTGTWSMSGSEWSIWCDGHVHLKHMDHSARSI